MNILFTMRAIILFTLILIMVVSCGESKIIPKYKYKDKVFYIDDFYGFSGDCEVKSFNKLWIKTFGVSILYELNCLNIPETVFVDEIHLRIVPSENCDIVQREQK